MENDFLSFNVEYKFSSGISSREPEDCITEYKAELYAADSEQEEYAGEIGFKIIDIGQAETNGFSIYDVFDTYEYTFRHGNEIYDFETGTLKKTILYKFPDLESFCNKLCIIETIGIIPKYRGKDIGAKVFKDLVWHFDYCELFILQPYPLQFDYSNRNKDLWPRLELEKFEKNEKKAVDSLSKYYQSWGFQKVKGIKDLLFYCTIYQNEIFENIDM